MTRFITVAAAKGGVGKTTIAYELAATLEAPLVDLDWDQGGATKKWGYNSSAYPRAPLLDALDAGPDSPRVPTLKKRARHPMLLPSHPDLASQDPPSDFLIACLERWADAWGYPYVVIDTHPGLNALTDGAMGVAHAVVVPVVMATMEMDALYGLLDDYRDHPLILVPNMVKRSISERWLKRVLDAAGNLPVTDPISEYGNVLRQRIRHTAITLQKDPGKAIQKAAAEFRAVAEQVAKLADKGQGRETVDIVGTPTKEAVGV